MPHLLTPFSEHAGISNGPIVTHSCKAAILCYRTIDKNSGPMASFLLAISKRECGGI